MVGPFRRINPKRAVMRNSGLKDVGVACLHISEAEDGMSGFRGETGAVRGIARVGVASEETVAFAELMIDATFHWLPSVTEPEVLRKLVPGIWPAADSARDIGSWR